MSQTTQRPATDDPSAWRAYWQTSGVRWRSEPEIGEPRQAYLRERLGITPDMSHGVYPFGAIPLTRADVEWLIVHAAEEESKQPTLVPVSQPATAPAIQIAFPNVFPYAPVQAYPYPSTVTGAIVDVTAPPASPPFYPPGLTDLESSTSGVKPLNEAPALDLRGANLRGINLRGLPLARLRGGLTQDEWRATPPDRRTQAGVQLDKADLSQATLDGAILGYASLRETWLYQTSLIGADLSAAHLEDSRLYQTHLESANLYQAHLDHARCFQTLLAGADLRRVAFDGETTLDEISLSDTAHGSAQLADVRWGDANLTVVPWEQLTLLGDERDARAKRTNDGKIKSRHRRRLDYQVAERATRQLAVALQAQGMSEDAARFTYRAQNLQREVYRRRGWRYFGAWVFSGFLATLTGYGYRMGRILIAYALAVFGFAAIYFALGVGCSAGSGACTSNQPLWKSLLAALVVSVTAFHGRVFSLQPQPASALGVITAIEAVVGLVLESVFIAMLTQKLFSR
ncbi:MAG TPA: pentapeptide repeat-containing protein [Ktedonobacterales bacterium]|nr:pentapeptide repeat-containing protein [Ktedonobacterales bacterium]